MKLLALDSSTLHLTLALGEGEPGAFRVLREAHHPPGINHSVLLPRVIEALVQAEGLQLRDLSGLVVGTGPGSFTGLRIGIASLKGMAYALRLPLAGVSSLDALAHAAPAGPERLVPLLDARRGELYARVYRREAGALVPEGPHLCLSAAQLVAHLRGLGDGPWHLFGEGEAVARATLEAGLGAYRRDASPIPQASALLALLPSMPAFEASALFAVEPLYVRPIEAEWVIKPKKGALPAPGVP
jgi:tRNA threonylcarbamoyladenosine biosynthesis protein TsaB